jgi:hypothetical protein
VPPQRDELETKYQRVSPEEVEEGWKHVHEVSAVACMHGDNCSVGDACQVNDDIERRYIRMQGAS